MEIDMDDALPGTEAGLVSDAGQGERSELSGVIVDRSNGDARNWNSEPFFKWVLWEAFDEGVNDDKLWVAAAVHAVILESGFICLDSLPAMAIGHSHLHDELPSSCLTISLSYTLPEILTDGSISTNNVVLKFQSLGQFVIVYASSSGVGSVIHRLALDQSKFAPALELMQLMLVKCDMNDTKKNRNDEVFDLWKMVKDGLALPLLIDLREKAGLSAPPCFMSVPKELQRRIIEFLPGVDVAKVGSVCSELRHLCSDNDLWKLKLEEEFGLRKLKFQEEFGRRKLKSRGTGGTNHKHLFAVHWSRKKRSERAPALRYLVGGIPSDPNGIGWPSPPFPVLEMDRANGIRVLGPPFYMGGGFNFNK